MEAFWPAARLFPLPLHATTVIHKPEIAETCAAQAPDGQVDPFVEMTLIDPEREKPEMQVSCLI